MTIAARARRLADDPIGLFNYNHRSMFDVPRAELDALHLEASRYRFGQLRDKLPMLTKLADKQNIHSLETIDDLVPLLFEHTMYKSYPASLLEKSRFDQLTKWLGKLTTIDLSHVDVSGCDSIDSWIALLDRETPIRLCHSSGTTGTMSFLPIHDAECHIRGGVLNALMIKERSPNIPAQGTLDDPLNMQVLYPYFRAGGKIILRLNDYIVKYIAGGEENFHSAFPGRISSDLEYLAARVRAAQVSGKLDQLQISPEMIARKEEFDALQKEMPARLEKFVHEALTKYSGQTVYMTGTWNLLYNMALAVRDQGKRQLFSRDSFILTGGGAKGITPPADWKEIVQEYLGVGWIQMAYGMSEITGCHIMCEHGHYHLAPWQVPFMLDPDTSKPLPRAGRVTGRAAFFDLVPSTRWGGFITGDEVTFNWNSDCPCGRVSPYYLDSIERYSEKRGGDDKISCAATPEAHADAMSFLNTFNA